MKNVLGIFLLNSQSAQVCTLPGIKIEKYCNSEN